MRRRRQRPPTESQACAPHPRERPSYCIEQKVIDLFRTLPLGQHFLAAPASALHIDLLSPGGTSIETASSSNLGSEVGGDNAECGYTHLPPLGQ